MEMNKIICGDALEELKKFPDNCVDMVITSPPYYGLRDYGVEGQIGLEKTLNEYLDKMLAITAELKRVLKKTGTMWWNHGDSYASQPPGKKTNGQLNKGDGLYGRLINRNGIGDKNAKVNIYKQFQIEKNNGKQSVGKMGEHISGRCRTFDVPEKSQLMQNYRLAIRMIDEQQWILRNTIIWHKPNCMPSSVKDRFTVDYEPVFFFSKLKKYWFEPQYEPHIWGDKDKRSKRHWSKNKAKSGKMVEQRYAMGQVSYGKLGRNKRSVWKIPTHPYSEAHFATFPLALIEIPIKAGCPEFICKKCREARYPIIKSEYQKKEVKWHNEKYGNNDEKGVRRGRTQPDASVKNTSKKIGYTDCGCNVGWDSGIVLDPFMGSGTTAYAARQLGRNYIGIDISEAYCKLAKNRLAQEVLLT